MMPMLQAALMVRALNDSDVVDRPVLVTRPRGVVHVAVAPVTPSGRFIPVTAAAVCRSRTRRLSVVPRSGAAATFRERRVCGRCIRVLAGRVPGLDGRPLPREVEADLFSFLSVANLVTVARSCKTVEETHQVGRLASVLFGQPTMKPKARRTVEEQAVVELHDEIVTTRRRLTAAERTPEERAALQQRRETQIFNDALAEKQRRRAAAIDRALERQRRGGYLTPRERELLHTA